MVILVNRKKGNKNYYYLKHGTRKRQQEKYIGTSIPKDIERLKEEFLYEFYRQDWHPGLQEIFACNKKLQKKMPKSIRKKQLETFSVHFTYNTQKIEGSTLTLRETANLLVDGITPSQKPESDMLEAKQHQRIFFEMLEHKTKLTTKTLLYWHERIFGQTNLNIASKTRRYGVQVTGSKFEFPSWDEVDDLLGEMFRWYEKNKIMIHPVELAAMMHLKFVTIHPFGDGNGRISRLLLNCILDEHDYPMLIIEYKDRPKYYSALETSQLKNNPFDFVRWLVNLYIKKNQNVVREWYKSN